MASALPQCGFDRNREEGKHMAGLRRTGRILVVALIPWAAIGCAATNSRLGQLASRSAEEQEALWARGQMYEKEGRYPEAQQIYAELYRRDEKSPRYAHRLGVVSTMMGDHERAISAYARARELDAENPELLADMGYAAFLRKEYQQAETLLRASLSRSGENPRAKTNLALTVGMQGRYDESLELFRQVHGQDEAEVLCNLAYVKSQRGDVSGAKELYKQALAIDPTMSRATVALAELKSGQANGQQMAQQKSYRKYMNENAPKPPKPRALANKAAEAAKTPESNEKLAETTVAQEAIAEEPTVTLTAKTETKEAGTKKADPSSTWAEKTWESSEASPSPPRRAIPDDGARVPALSSHDRPSLIPVETAAPAVERGASEPQDDATAMATAVVDELEGAFEVPEAAVDGWTATEAETFRPEFLDSRAEQVSVRRGQAGFMGFCPVALRDEQNLVDALPQYTAEYQSQSYQFSSEEALKKFQAHPERYVAAAGGLDVVAVSQGTAVAQGSLEHALWFRHKLYLFLSRENMEVFRAQARQFAVQQ
jgi:Flp pilus assembly protein TadD/YHS domain-containing protein